METRQSNIILDIEESRGGSKYLRFFGGRLGVRGDGLGMNEVRTGMRRSPTTCTKRLELRLRMAYK